MKLREGMPNRHRRSVAHALSGRHGFLQLVLVGVLLALATNILATAVTSAVAWSTAVALGLLLLTVVAAYAIRTVLAARVIHRSFDAALVLSPDDLQPQKAEIYEFSGDMERILKAVFAENKAFADAWRREPVTKHWDLDSRRGTASRVQEGAGLRLLHEALETWLIQELSTQLTDYYDHLPESERDTVTFERQHVPSLLLDNRVLNLLSTPVADRAAFLDGPAATVQPADPAGQPESEAVVYAQFGPGGALFERFELVLPKGSKLSRQPSGALTIDTPRLHLSLRAKYEGFSASVPFRLVSRYYGLSPFEVASLLIRFELTGRVKPLGLLRSQGWHLYHWVDSFVDRIEEAASVEAMLVRIQWPTVEALLIAGEEPRKGSV